MQEQSYEGLNKLTDNATTKQILDAIENPTNRFTAIHNIGSRITMADGRQYEVQSNGSWKKVQ